MKFLLKTLFFAVMLFCIASQCFATHNRAGEIVYKHISGYKYKITIYTYCYTQTEADRPELELDCGDGTGKITLKRTSKTLLDSDESMSLTFLCKNVYEGEHTFSGPGTYVLYMEDPNRNDGVDNIPNSVNVVFSLKTTLIITPATGKNSSPVLLNSPMDVAALGETFIHNPGAYDPDGDSLSYKIATCLQQDGQEIIGYSLPPVTDSIFVDPYSGDFVWQKPAKVGTYNVAMWIEEWRNGIKIGQVLRDIQVSVIDTRNHTPIINKNNNHCVLADNRLSFDVSAYDPDGDLVMLTATGGPFVVPESPATFTVPETWSHKPVGHFDWLTRRSHIRRLPYDMLVKCLDNDKQVPLTAYESVKITVIAPAPEILSIKPTNSTVNLVFNKGGNYNCVGYKIYRADRPSDYQPGVCETGIPASSGYELIAEIDNPKDTVFIDSNNGKGLPNGFRYCYRVTAVFADGAESQVSDNACTTLIHGIVTFTKVSVEQTDKEKGRIHVEWQGPDRLDTISVPPPYYYQVQSAHNIYDGVYGTPKQFEGVENTQMTESSINTYSDGSRYLLTFGNTDPDTKYFSGIGESSNATSVFIKTRAADRRVTITHTCEVPWRNERYVIYRRDPGQTEYDSVGCSTTGTYTDYDLENDVEYWYKMKTVGYFSAEGLPTYIENWSQEASATPIDTIAPCVKCDVRSNCTEAYNHITWSADTTCGLGIAKYFLYYAETIDASMHLLAEFEPTVEQFDHYPELGMAGCYYVTALDSAGNKGVVDSRVCVDQCEYYRLPNVFTPNGDGNNDLFHPYPYQFVDHVEMTVTNRWGKVVFTSNDPDLNWDGTDQDTGKQLPDGVYHYRCIVWEYRLTGLEDRELQGYITIFTNKTKN